MGTLAVSVAGLAGAASLVVAIERPLAIGRAVVIRAIAGGAAFAAGRNGEAAVVVDQLSRSGIPDEDAAAAVGRTRLAAWATWAAVTAVALVEALDTIHGLVRPDHLAALASVVIVAWSAHVALALLSNRRRSESSIALLQRRSDRPDASGTFSWVPVATAKLVEVAAGAFGSVAVVTAFNAPVPASHVIVIHLVGWAVVHLVPVTPAAAARPAIIAIGLAASGAALPVAVAVASLVATVEWAGRELGLTRSHAR